MAKATPTSSLDMGATIPYPPRWMDERTTRVLDTALFQYIARQLWDVKQLLEAERREGLIKEHRFKNIATGTIYDIRRDEGVEFCIADVFNEGPNTVYVKINYKRADEITLSAGQIIVLNHEKAKSKIKWLRFRCDSGESANVRVIGQW